jgi:hypothetical protein
MLAFSPSLKLCAMASGHRRVVLPCQRARRQRWQRDKMQADPDCRENQLRSQHAWLERRPEYCVTTTTSIRNTCCVLDWPMIWGMLGNDLDGRAAIDQG